MAKNDAKKKKPTTIMSCADISSNFSKYVKTNDSKALLKGFRGLLLRERKEEEAENGRGKDAINDEEKFFSDAKRAMGLSDAIVKVGFMRSCGRVGRASRRFRRARREKSSSFRLSPVACGFRLKIFVGTLVLTPICVFSLSLSLFSNDNNRHWKTSRTKATSRTIKKVAEKKRITSRFSLNR